MATQIILASQSSIRSELLRRSNVPFQAEPARVDEESITAALLAENAHPRDIADALAEAKAQKVASRFHAALVLGSDQVLAKDEQILSKPRSETEAMDQLFLLRGGTHVLYSAAVIYEDSLPVWRHVGRVRMTMRPLSDAFIEDYVMRNWTSIQTSVGAYKIEEEGARLFSNISGDYFSVLGMPLLEVLNYLTLRGTLPG